MAQESRFAGLLTFLRLFANPLVLILLVASGISLGLGDQVGGVIIIAIVLLSVLLNFFMEFQARHAVAEIRKQVATTAAVMRDGQDRELPIAELVPGDVVRLNAGDLMPFSLLGAIAASAVTYLLGCKPLSPGSIDGMRCFNGPNRYVPGAIVAGTATMTQGGRNA